jgi:hypothetical protein
MKNMEKYIAEQVKAGVSFKDIRGAVEKMIADAEAKAKAEKAEVETKEKAAFDVMAHATTNYLNILFGEKIVSVDDVKGVLKSTTVQLKEIKRLVDAGVIQEDSLFQKKEVVKKTDEEKLAEFLRGFGI